MIPLAGLLLSLAPGLPPLFPEQVPLPPGAEIQQVHDRSGAPAGHQSIVVTLKPRHGSGGVLDFYRAALTRMGAQVQEPAPGVPVLSATLPGWQLTVTGLGGLGTFMVCVEPEGGTFSAHHRPQEQRPPASPLDLPKVEVSARRLSGGSYPGDNDPGALLVRRADGSLWGFGAGLVHSGRTDAHGKRYCHKEAVPLEPTRIASGVRFATVAPGAPYGAVFFIDGEGTLRSQGADCGGRIGQGVWDATFRWFDARPILASTRFVAAGPCTTAAITEDGGLHVWGSNLSGQIPGTREPSVQAPVRVMEQVVHVAVARDAIYAVKRDGTLWGWGEACEDGFLDGGVVIRRELPYRIMEGVKAVYTADNGPVMAIKADGSLWTWGANSFAQCGQGNRSVRARPALIAREVVSVAMNGRHAALLKSDGSAWTWGWNWGAHCGFPAGEPDILRPRRLANGVIDIAVTSGETYVLMQDGSLWGTGRNADGYALLGKAVREPGLRRVAWPRN